LNIFFINLKLSIKIFLKVIEKHRCPKHSFPDIRYVENQREHHKLYSFKEELTPLLKEHSVEYIDDYLIT
jgi:hypothetical protein